ncbi:MAG: hypothetical protein PHD72_04325 [Patescibacteria group bacterium]|nr:hypothetical protein [Patescibacteria group bacterium]
MKKRLTIIFTFALLVGGWLIFCNQADMAQENGDINVQFTVPSSGTTPPDGGGGVEPSDQSPPVIADVTSTVNLTTSTVTWTATDNYSLSSCNLNYGPTTEYATLATTNRDGGNFWVNFSGLQAGTNYYFLITCLDGSSNQTQSAGSFTTLSPGFTGTIHIRALPEKRVTKTGGNSAVDAQLLLVNPTTHQTVYTKNISLDNAGSSTLRDTAVPTGHYNAVLKGQSHLSKKIIGVNIVAGNDMTLDFSDAGAFYLLAGDVQGTGLKDNQVDILDVSAEDVKFRATDLNNDLNRDGIVDVLDMSIILVNYNKSGDPIS